MLNKVILVGRLTKKPKSKKLSEDVIVINFSIALNRQYTKKETTDYINCTAWNKTAKLIEQYLSKGSLIAVEGRLQQDRYQTVDGTKKQQLKVICENVQFLESKAMLEERRAFQQNLDKKLEEFENDTNDDVDF